MHLTTHEYDRFMARVVKKGDCWLWQGHLDRDGYGSFFLRRKSRRAHRVGWFMLNGEIPEGMVVNHKCGKRSCVNPQHLDLLTMRDNSLIDSRGAGAINARKTHCPQGHPYDRVHGSGKTRQRICSICASAKSARLRAKWAAEDSLKV